MKFKSLQKGFALVLAILTITVGIPFSAFAQSEGSIVVTFAPGTDDTVGETVTNSYDAETVITLPECTFTREGFEFAGWFDGTDIYEAGAEYTAAGDITFTPVWNNILATRVYYSADGKVDTNGDGVIDVVNATVADNTLVGSYAQTGITGVMNLYSGTFSDITCIASGGSASAACDSVYNIYGGDITGNIFGVSRYGGNENIVHTLNGNNTYNIYGGNFAGVISSAWKRGSVLNGILTFNINGGKFTEGMYFGFGTAQWSAQSEINGAQNFIINNKEIAENGGSLAGVSIGIAPTANSLTKYDNLIIVMNNAEYAAQTGAVVSESSVATHTLYVNEGKATPKFDEANTLLGFEIVSDNEGLIPAANGVALNKNENGYYDVTGTAEITFVEYSTATFVPGTDDTHGATVETAFIPGVPFALPSCAFTREGFEFAGWFDGTDIYEAGAEYAAAGDITFTPVWNNILATRVYYSADGKVDTNGDGVIDVVNATVADNTLVGSYAQPGITGVMNLYSGTFSDITCIASGGSTSAACDSVYNIYGGDITGNIFGVSRYGGNENIVHTLNGNNTYNIYGGNFAGVISSAWKRGSVLNGILTFNINGGTFTEGMYFAFGTAQWSAQSEINGAQNFIINNKEIAENGGSLAGVSIGIAPTANSLTKYDNLIIVMNNAEYAAQTGAVVSESSVATHTLYVNEGKATPKFDDANTLLGFEIVSDNEGLVPATDGVPLAKNTYGYYDITGTVEISFVEFDTAEYCTATYTPNTDDTQGSTIEISVVAGSPFVLPPCTFTREGFEFAGWYDRADIYEAGSEYTANADIAFVPVWRNVLDTRDYYSADGKVDTNGDGIIDVVDANIGNGVYVANNSDISKTINVYSGDFADFAPIVSGTDATITSDTVFNIYGGNIANIFATSRYSGGNDNTHIVNGKVTYNIYDGNFAGVIASSMQRNSYLYGIATFNINGGKFTGDGAYFKFGSTGYSAHAVVGSVNFIINNKEITENEGTLENIAIGQRGYALTDSGYLVIVMNNNEYAGNTGAVIADDNIATHILYVNGGKATPKYNDNDTLIGFEIVSDQEGLAPIVNGMPLTKNEYGYYDITGTAEITFGAYNIITYAPGTDDTAGKATNVAVSSDESFTLPECSFTREGFEFAGWFDGTSIYAAGAEYTANGDITFTPVWNNIISSRGYYSADGTVDTNGDGKIDIVNATVAQNKLVGSLGDNGVNAVMNLYSGTFTDITCLASGTSSSYALDSVYNIYGGTITGNVFGISRCSVNNGTVHTLTGHNTYNIYGGTFANENEAWGRCLTTSWMAGSVLNGTLTFNISGGTIEEGSVIGFGGTQSTSSADINGAHNIIINNKEIAENNGSLAGVSIGVKGNIYSALEADYLIVVMNNAEYAEQSGAVVSESSVATHTLYVNEGKATPKFDDANTLLGFEIVSDNEGYYPAVNGKVLHKDTNGYYKIPAGVSEISFVNEIDYTTDGSAIEFFKEMDLDLSTVAHNEIEGKIFMGWTYEDGTVLEDASFINGDKIYAQYVDFVPENDFYIEGAQIRLENKENEIGEGLRFVIRRTDATDALNIKSYGSIIVPSLPLGKSELEIGAVYTYNFVEYAVRTVPADKILALYDDYEQYTVCVTQISDKRYATLFSVRGYIEYTDYNGYDHILYTDYYATNLVNVAQALLDDETVIDETARNRCETIVSTEKQRVKDKYNNLEKITLSNNYTEPELVADVSLDDMYQLGEGGVTVRELLIETGDENAEAVEIFQLTDLHFNYVNKKDFEEANPTIIASYNGRQWLKDGESVPNAVQALEYASQGDAVVITGDVIDFMSHGAVELTQKYIWDPYPNTLITFGNHDFERRCQDTPATPDPTTYKSRYDFLQDNWNHDVYYTSKVIKDKVMIIQLENGTTKFWESQIQLLTDDLALAREMGYTVLLFYHIPLCTNNPEETNLYPIRRNDTYTHNFCDNGVGYPGTTDSATVAVYDIITNNADIIDATFCGHLHSDYKTEIIAKNADGSDAVIPQYVLTGNPYDGGHALKITVK